MGGKMLKKDLISPKKKLNSKHFVHFMKWRSHQEEMFFGGIEVGVAYIGGRGGEEGGAQKLLVRRPFGEHEMISLISKRKNWKTINRRKCEVLCFCAQCVSYVQGRGSS